MQAFEDRIRQQGRVLPGDIVKVDGFLNHLVDIKLMEELADQFRKEFPQTNITKILTVEASGIPLGTVTAQKFGVPMIFAKKAKSDNIEGGLYRSDIYSYTYNKKVTLIISKEWLHKDDVVLIIDDFLANGEALRGLVEIVDQSGAQLVGIGIAIEKGFQQGGVKIRERGINLHSLAIIESANEQGITFREQELS